MSNRLGHIVRNDGLLKLIVEGYKIGKIGRGKPKMENMYQRF